MPDTVFGPLVTGASVERWAMDTLKLWTPEYLAWIERTTGRVPRSLPVPRSWVHATGADRWAEESLPSVLLVSTGLADPPMREGKGSYRAKYDLGVAVVVSAKDQAQTDELAKLYTTAFRLILLQHPSLGGHAAAVEWVDERYDALPGSDRRRTLSSGSLVFRVEVRDVAASRGGPMVPRDDPYSPYPDGPVVLTTEGDVQPTEEPSP